MDWLLLLRGILLSVIGAGAGVAVKTWAQNRRFLPLLSVRDVSGWWKGLLRTGEPGQEVWVLFHKQTRWQVSYWLSNRVVTGSVWDGMVKNIGQDKDILFELRGGFYLSDHIMLDYQSKKPASRQIGTMLLKLDAKGASLEGQIVGYEDATFTDKVSFKRDTQYSPPDPSQPLQILLFLIGALGLIVGLVALMVNAARLDIVPEVGKTYSVAEQRKSLGRLLEGYTSHFSVVEGGGIDLWESVFGKDELKGRCLKHFSLFPAPQERPQYTSPQVPTWYLMGCGGLPATFRLDSRTPDETPSIGP